MSASSWRCRWSPRDRQSLGRVATAVLERDDAVTALLLEAAEDGDAWQRVVAVLDRRGGNALNLLDLTVELSQQAEGQGRPAADVGVPAVPAARFGR